MFASNMNLAPDYTIFIQIGLFVIAWVGLSRIAFTPTSEVLEQRRERTVEAEAQAVAMVAAAESDRETYDKTVHERRAHLAAETTVARNRAQEESAAVLARARDSANEALAAQRSAVAGQVETARSALADTAGNIARQMLSRVSGGKA